MPNRGLGNGRQLQLNSFFSALIFPSNTKGNALMLVSMIPIFFFVALTS
jgi:hypothetical protein